LADELFSRFLYTAQSRYARPEGGDEESVDAIMREHLLTFYETRYVPGGTTIIAAGDVSVRRRRGDGAPCIRRLAGSSPERVVSDDVPRGKSAPCTSSRRATRRRPSCDSDMSAFRGITRTSFR
jgi:hypothetical protein